VGAFYILLIICTGSTVYKYRTAQKPVIDNSPAKYYGIILDIPEEYENSIGTIIKIKASRKDSIKWKKQSAKIISYFEKDSLSANLKPGETILFRSQVDTTQNMGNPSQFDYKQYLAVNGIYHTTYIPSDRWKRTKLNKIRSLRASSNKLRLNLIKKLKDQSITEKEYAVASALILGFKGYLTEDLTRKFSISGAMHILAVSGLHVGIIYMLFHYLLLFMDRYRKTKIIKTLIIILILIAYAFITGLSPSVSRATLMFSIIAIGSTLSRDTSIYNSLAFSAFILLFINPLLIHSVGFQLSYCAVLGIVFFQPRLYRILNLPAVPDKLWQWFTVAIAAQIGTAPLGILYFHQFSNYFWITNFFAIPAAMLIIITGILFFSLEPLSAFLGNLFGWLLNKILLSLNFLIDLVNSLPFASLSGLWLEKVHVILIYGMILTTCFYLIKKTPKQIILGLIFIIVIIAFDIQKTLNLQNKKMFLVYNIPGKSVYNYISPDENLVIKVNSIENNQEAEADILKFFTEDFWLKNRAEPPKIVSIKKEASVQNTISGQFYLRGNYFSLEDTRFYVLNNNSLANKKTKEPLKIDYLILSGESDLPVNKIKELFRFKKIILDSSLDYYERQKWIKRLKKKAVPYFDITDQGAFQIEISQKKTKKI
jgi:competence protein ComEC